MNLTFADMGLTGEKTSVWEPPATSATRSRTLLHALPVVGSSSWDPGGPIRGPDGSHGDPAPSPGESGFAYLPPDLDCGYNGNPRIGFDVIR